MFKVSVSSRGLEARLQAVAAKVKNVEPVLKAWATETAIDIGQQWNTMTYGKLYMGSADFRSKAALWRRVKPLYVRKDGTAIPPWGGVKRVRRKSIGFEIRQIDKDVIVRDAMGNRVDVKHVKRLSWKQKFHKDSGVVLGRMRPSGKRVKPGDIVGKDTQTMFRQFIREPKLSPSKRSISLVTNTRYAKPQNTLRSFSRLKKSDRERLARIYRDYLVAILRSARRV